MKNQAYDQKNISSFFFKTNKNVGNRNILGIPEENCNTPLKEVNDVFSPKKSSIDGQKKMQIIEDDINKNDVKRNIINDLEKTRPVNKTNILNDFKSWLNESKEVWNSLHSEDSSSKKSNYKFNIRSKNFKWVKNF